MASHHFNPYQILGVAGTAPDEVIRAAFRVLTQKYHPDRNSAPDADTRTAEIIRAYELLRDPEARARYDRDAERSRDRENGGDDAGAPPESDAGLAEPYVCEEGAVFETEYAIMVQPAIVREHSVSYVPQQVERNDQRPFVGKGRYVETVHTARQQIWLKLAHVDRNLVHEGSELEVAVGHRVTLLSVFRPGASKRPVDAVLVNHSTNQWLELRPLSMVAVDIQHPRDTSRRLGRAALWIAGGLAMLYLLIRLHAIGWMFALFLGAPAIVVITLLLTDKEGDQLTKAIQGALLRAA